MEIGIGLTVDDIRLQTEVLLAPLYRWTTDVTQVDRMPDLVS